MLDVWAYPFSHEKPEDSAIDVDYLEIVRHHHAYPSVPFLQVIFWNIAGYVYACVEVKQDRLSVVLGSRETLNLI